ncbi:hypothetical protein L195_g049499, partial [Trifolium pratense]
RTHMGEDLGFADDFRRERKKHSKAERRSAVVRKTEEVVLTAAMVTLEPTALLKTRRSINPISP